MSESTGLLEDILKGKTLQIYWFLLKSGESGVREIQKQLKIPSSSTVHYHLNKLLNLGLVKQNNKGKYFIEEEVKTGILGLYIKIGRRMIPRMLFYLSFFLVVGLLYLVTLFLSPRDIELVDLLFLLLALSGFLIFSYETYKIWHMQPL
ncbi:MAG: winged helix-turn-helix domain-containing protein [Candidatus Hodarchaeales archaeon]